MQIGVLGRLQALHGNDEVDLGSRKQRVLLAGLALTPNRVVSTDALVELLWRGHPPAVVDASLHGYVAGLRRALEPGRAVRDRSQVIIRRDAGYELRIGVADLDSTRFAAAVSACHQLLADPDPFGVPEKLSSDDTRSVAEQIQAALAWWRGLPFPELDDDPTAVAERARLEDLQVMALQDQARAQLALGRHTAVAADLASLVRAHPLREDLWGLRALALARDGRQAEALDTLQAARTVLADELGIDPGPRLQQLQLAILRQDPRVIRHPHPGDGPSPPDPGGRPPASSAGEVPLVGREDELAALDARASEALTGAPHWALLVGEPGIGKTRLTQAFAAHASTRGFLPLIGRCSQEEGAPPLWPWVAVLKALADTWPEIQPPDLESTDPRVGTGSATSDRFRTFDAVTRLLVEVSATHPLLLVFDDLHWADPSSLRLLRHLVDTTERARLLVVATRRARPAPHGPLAELGESLARRGVLRIELAGLSAEDVTALAGATTGTPPDQDEASDLRDRTGGNPFFLVEVLRLGRSRLQELGHGPVPPAVGDVIAARVGQLPVDTQELLRLCSVLGGSVDLELLARLQGRSEGDVLDTLDPAMAAGTVIEMPDDRLQFSHALVRDAVYATIAPLRRRRRHAEVARLLESEDTSGRRRGEIARHWLQAGSHHAARAWAAASEAAAHASRLQAHEEAADLLAAAVRSQAGDEDATPEQRYDLLMARARACRASANSDGQRSATAAAIRLAAEAADIERLALAAITSSEGALWSNRPQGEVDAATVAALHRAVRELPGGDTPLRCRVFLALSRELYWAPQPQEREAHAELGLAMARRLDDPQLHAWACHTAYIGAFRPATLPARTDLAAEAVACSREAGDDEGETIGLLLQAIALGEAGRLSARRDAVRGALALAERNRFRYLQVMLGSYEVPWLALEGRFAEADQLYADTLRWGAHTSFPFRDEALAAARLCLELWRGRPADLLPSLTALDEAGPVDLSSALLLLRLRSGQPGDVAAHLERRPPSVRDDAFDAPMVLALCAEAALVVRRPELAAQVYPLVAPWAGRFMSAGTGAPLGPADGFLALAAAAVGERELAAEHADRALAICAEEHLDPVAEWLTGYRMRHGF